MLNVYSSQIFKPTVRQLPIILQLNVKSRCKKTLGSVKKDTKQETVV